MRELLSNGGTGNYVVSVFLEGKLLQSKDFTILPKKNSN
jgi:hypothetical protein